MLSDLGGIYTLGVSPGTALLGNHIHGIDRLKYGGWGIYHDSGSSHILSRDNVVHDTRDGAFMQGRGRDNHQVNNVFAYGREAQLYLYNKEETAAATLERNLVVWDGGKLISGTWKNDNFRSNRNLYWCATGAPEFTGMPLAEWREKTGQDKDSIVADPGFADAEARDFRLRPRLPRPRSRLPAPDPSLAVAAPVPSPPAPPGPSRPGRRTTCRARSPSTAPSRGLPEGSQPLLPDCYQDDEKHGIRVSSAFAAEGRNCLEFRDGPTANSWNPHLVYTTSWREGTLRCSFALRHQPGAVVTHQWRTSMPPFVASGPSFTIGAGGTLALPGHEPLAIPAKRLGSFRGGLLPGAPPRPCMVSCGDPPGRDNPALRPPRGSNPFDRLGWVGFISAGTEPATFHLDDVALGPVPGAE